MSYYPPIVAVLVTLLASAIIVHVKFSRKIQDIPNERSLHAVPIPRMGGVCMFAGILFSWLIMIAELRYWLILPLIFLIVVSFIDDLRGVPVSRRLLVHFAAAAIMIAGSDIVQHGIILALALLLLTVWMTNLYNFMDGSDGLAGGMTLIGFGIYGVAALMGNHEQFAMLNFSVAAAAAGLLYFNFYPAKIFMGDTGSIPLGFLAATMGMWGWQKELWPAWFPMLVFSPFVLDASVTLVKRALRREKIWQAHREHYYQRILMLGVGHRNTALIEYGLMVGAGSSALWAMQQPAAAAYILILCGIAYALSMLLVDKTWNARRHE